MACKKNLHERAVPFFTNNSLGRNISTFVTGDDFKTFLKFKSRHARSILGVVARNFVEDAGGFMCFAFFGEAEMSLGTATNVVYVAWYCDQCRLCRFVLRPMSSMLLRTATTERQCRLCRLVLRPKKRHCRLCRFVLRPKK